MKNRMWKVAVVSLWLCFGCGGAEKKAPGADMGDMFTQPDENVPIDERAPADENAPADQPVPADQTTLTCTDEDQDGYGVGQSCRGPDCDDAAAACNTDCQTDDDADSLRDCDDGCLDADGDGYGLGDDCMGADCADAFAGCATDCTTDADSDGAADCAETCLDADRDGYGNGVGCQGPDCDDQDSACHSGCEFDSDGDGVRDCSDSCTDQDGDGYGAGPDCDGPDCDDMSAACMSNCLSDEDEDGVADCADTCLDFDNDGFGSGPSCQGVDCDDQMFTCTTDCRDQDGDGIADCRHLCQDADGDTFCAELNDCDDLVAACNVDCVSDADGDGLRDCEESCVDLDGDGYGSGPACTGPDCNDDLAACNTDCSTDSDGNGHADCTEVCLDGDGDGYGVGLDCQGLDCNDADWLVHPGRDEACNNRDDDCDGQTDEDMASTAPLCLLQQGECAGTRTPDVLCVAGEWLTCDATVYVAHSSSYEAAHEQICDDQRDNDCDGQADCDDMDCWSIPDCMHENDCGDLADNDLDGQVDCDDPDCSEAVFCMPLVTVAAGPFRMGCNATLDSQCSGRELPGHEVVLPDYQIGMTEVTVAQYDLCVQSGACSQPASGAGCNGGMPERRHHPINCVTWSQADTYCEWRGMRLCTEAEWEKAARGGCEQYADCDAQTPVYPWGEQEVSCTLAIYDEGGLGGTGCGAGTTWPVGSADAGASPYGILDMAGNVAEWVADWYGSDYYCMGPNATVAPPWTFCQPDDSPYQQPWNNPTGPAAGTLRLARGGGFNYEPWALRAGSREDSIAAEETWPNIGFRCCR